MNLRQPFEQLIAGKLRQLPTPDAATSWQQMKRLLDDDDNRGGGGKRPPGNGGWWRMGIIAIVLLTGTWLFVEKSGKTSLAASKNNMSAAPQPGTGSTANNSVNKETATIDHNTTLPVTTQTASTATPEVAGNTNTASGESATAAVNTNNTVAPEKTTETASAGNAALPIVGTSNKNNAGTAPVIKNTAAAKNKSHKSTVANNPPLLIKSDAAATESNSTAAENHFTSNKENKIALVSLRVSGNKLNKTRLHAAGLTGVDENSTAAADEDAQNKTASSLSKKSRGIKHVPGKFTGNTVREHNNRLALQDDKNGYTSFTSSGLAYTTASGRQKTWFERLTALKAGHPLPSFNAALAAGDSMSNERSTDHLLNAETKKAVARAQRDKAFEAADRKERKQFHLNLSNLFKPFSLRVDTDPWWAAGLSLNSGVTLNTQNRFNYNVNAKSSTLSDYIPSPYLQFHLNNYVYVQTELNLIAPQYTPQLLIYRKSNEITAQSGMSQQKSIYIQKMYYFNWPLSLHYSPISNFYFSGGIQFSSFQSGLASIEQKEYTTALGVDHPSNTYTTTLKFKDDSIASKIAPNEWRWQLGAEYYWNRFSVGLRYNQSFKNAINTTVSPLLPPTVSRNESMFLFIKYNLFESRRQNTIPKNQ